MAETEYTNIEVLVFENEDGSEQEMQIMDEFDYAGAHYLALVSADEGDGDAIHVYRALGEDDYEEIDGELREELLSAIEARIPEKY